MTHKIDSPEPQKPISSRTYDLVELELSHDLANAVREESQDMDVSDGELIRRAVQDFLESNRPPAPPEPPPVPPLPPKPKVRLRHVHGFPPPRASFALSGMVALWTL